MAEPRRLDTLDALRGLAAVGVVVWHWQMLLLLGGPKLTWPPLGGDPDRSGLPFYGPLKLYYEHGFWGVDLFFVLSGFIFFHLYRRPIAEGRTSAGRFFALRFSRLYPLHFLTLLLTAGLQAAFVHHAGQPFAYEGNDTRHFLANLAMVNVPDYAFNGPTWSLSVEIAMYALFWSLARTGLLKGRAAAGPPGRGRARAVRGLWRPWPSSSGAAWPVSSAAASPFGCSRTWPSVRDAG